MNYGHEQRYWLYQISKFMSCQKFMFPYFDPWLSEKDQYQANLSSITNTEDKQLHLWSCFLNLFCFSLVEFPLRNSPYLFQVYPQQFSENSNPTPPKIFKILWNNSLKGNWGLPTMILQFHIKISIPRYTWQHWTKDNLFCEQETLFKSINKYLCQSLKV